MLQAYVVIVVIVSGSYLHTACSELSIYHLVCYNDHFSVRQERMQQLFAYKVLETRVFRVNSYS